MAQWKHKVDKAANVPFARPHERLYASAFHRMHMERVLEVAYQLMLKHKGQAGPGIFTRYTPEMQEAHKLLHQAQQ